MTLQNEAKVLHKLMAVIEDAASEGSVRTLSLAVRVNIAEAILGDDELGEWLRIGKTLTENPNLVELT